MSEQACSSSPFFTHLGVGELSEEIRQPRPLLLLLALQHRRVQPPGRRLPLFHVQQAGQGARGRVLEMTAPQRQAKPRKSKKERGGNDGLRSSGVDGFYSRCESWNVRAKAFG